MTTLSPSDASLRRHTFGPIEIALRQHAGEGVPIVFVHGTLEDHNFWRSVIEHVARGHLGPKRPMITYDRRGHGASTDQPGQGAFSQDVDDLEAIVRELCGARAHLVGHSYGATIAIALSARAPECVASLFAFEAPLFGLLAERPETGGLLRDASAKMARALTVLEGGRIEEGVELFIDGVAFGDGAWRARMDRSARERMLANVDTWIDQARDPERFSVSADGLGLLGSHATLCSGSQSLPTFQAVTSALRERFAMIGHAEIEGAAHDAPATHPAAFARRLLQHLERAL